MEQQVERTPPPGRPGTPVAGLVAGLPPGGVNRPDRAETPGADDFGRGGIQRGMAGQMPGHQDAPGTGSGAGEGAGLAGAQGEGFFAEDMFARVEGGFGLWPVEAIRDEMTTASMAGSASRASNVVTGM